MLCECADLVHSAGSAKIKAVLYKVSSGRSSNGVFQQKMCSRFEASCVGFEDASQAQ
jgi:hypothetical protein